MKLLQSIKKRLGLRRQKSATKFREPAIDYLHCIRSGAQPNKVPEEALDFVRFAEPFAPQAKGQLFQDLWALWETGGRRDGYFVEIGAHNGIKRSNTYFLEQYGWNGIVAEPNPDHFESLHQNRRCHVVTDAVFSSSGQEVEFMVTRASSLSRLSNVNPGDLHEKARLKQARKVIVRTISPNDMLERAAAPSAMDFLSLDTEGSEFEILQALDFRRWHFKLITVEHNHTVAREQIAGLLKQHGYVRRWPHMNLFDDWYVHTSHVARRD